MRVTLPDLIATALLLALGIPYVGYLVAGEMPLVEDARVSLLSVWAVEVADHAGLVHWHGPTATRV